LTGYGETSAVEEFVNVHARHCRIGKVTLKLDVVPPISALFRHFDRATANTDFATANQKPG